MPLVNRTVIFYPVSPRPDSSSASNRHRQKQRRAEPWRLICSPSRAGRAPSPVLPPGSFSGEPALVLPRSRPRSPAIPPSISFALEPALQVIRRRQGDSPPRRRTLPPLNQGLVLSDSSSPSIEPGTRRMAAVNWNDDNTRIITELFADQVHRGNRANSHLNNVAYEEIAQRFKDKTGIELKKKQIKNKWDKLKNEYGIWKKLLLKQTGAGWEGGTINQDAEWWRKAKVDIPGCGRFQNQGIRNEDNLKLIFEDITNDGRDHWCPTSGDLPQPNIVEDVINLDGEDGIDIDELDESLSNVKGKKRGAKVVGDKSKKSTTSQVMQDEVKKIGALAEKTQSSLESFTTKNDTCSVATVMDLVIECGGAYGTNEHFIATELFVKREQREMLLHMPTPDIRFEWLKRKYEAKYAC